jgi:hypothetical protein
VELSGRVVRRVDDDGRVTGGVDRRQVRCRDERRGRALEPDLARAYSPKPGSGTTTESPGSTVTDSASLSAERLPGVGTTCAGSQPTYSPAAVRNSQ